MSSSSGVTAGSRGSLRQTALEYSDLSPTSSAASSSPSLIPRTPSGKQSAPKRNLLPIFSSRSQEECRVDRRDVPRWLHDSSPTNTTLSSTSSGLGSSTSTSSGTHLSARSGGGQSGRRTDSSSPGSSASSDNCQCNQLMPTLHVHVGECITGNRPRAKQSSTCMLMWPIHVITSSSDSAPSPLM